MTIRAFKIACARKGAFNERVDRKTPKREKLRWKWARRGKVQALAHSEGIPDGSPKVARIGRHVARHYDPRTRPQVLSAEEWRELNTFNPLARYGLVREEADD